MKKLAPTPSTVPVTLWRRSTTKHCLTLILLLDFWIFKLSTLWLTLSFVPDCTQMHLKKACTKSNGSCISYTKITAPCSASMSLRLPILKRNKTSAAHSHISSFSFPVAIASPSLANLTGKSSPAPSPDCTRFWDLFSFSKNLHPCCNPIVQN